ncbi:MAG TPA: RecX family transcriptional regulator [Gaiellaceae bacterium]|jgi:SOS response regulatory protein OraA/RecX
MPQVTALSRVGRDRVAVELDGRRWRDVPLEAAQLAGLAVGADLDRERARTLRRELRRADALATAARALRHSDQTRATLTRRLAARGFAPAERAETLAVLARAGVVDDERYAHGRAAALAARGRGNLLIASDLERQGVPPELVRAAIASLEPEPQRAERLLAAQGATPRTLRRLVAQGFGEETLEDLIAATADRAVG